MLIKFDLSKKSGGKQMTMTPNKKIALVTGGNRGIGFELVKQLAHKGFEVILTSRDSNKGLQALERLEAFHVDVSHIEMDLDDKESIQQAARIVNERYGRLDVLINSAGIILENKKVVEDPTILERTMQTNFFGAFHVISAFMPLMERNQFGRIVNVSSEYGALDQMSRSGVGAYKLSKYALNGLTQLIAAETSGDIKVNSVDPGWVSSDMGGRSAPITPKQAAESILLLTSPDHSCPNGGFFRNGKQIPW